MLSFIDRGHHDSKFRLHKTTDTDIFFRTKTVCLLSTVLRKAAKNNGLFLVARPLRGGKGFFEALKKFWEKICGH